LRLRDASDAPLLIERMNTAPGRWCAFAPAVYGEPGVEEAFERNLEAAFNGDGWQSPESVALHLTPEQLRRLLEWRRARLPRWPPPLPAPSPSSLPPAPLVFVRGVPPAAATS